LFSGTVTDQSSDLVEVKITALAPGEVNPRTMADWNFAPTGSFAFNKYLAFDKPGAWIVNIIARDADGLTSTTTITATITGAATCAFPELFDCQGNQILNGGGIDYHTDTQKNVAAFIGWGGNINVTAYWAGPAQFIPFGQFQLTCTTPGATIQFYTTGVIINAGALSNPPVSSTWLPTPYSAGYAPFHNLINPGTTAVGVPAQNVSSPVTTFYCIIARATAPGYANSAYVLWRIPLFI
jgi:hypothetical protein